MNRNQIPLITCLLPENGENGVIENEKMGSVKKCQKWGQKK
jgi:hypothetical protein